MSSTIVNVENGVLVNFEDGARSFFDADFLDKRIKTPRKRDSHSAFRPDLRAMFVTPGASKVQFESPHPPEL
jgi:hypothetical protein